ncbi:Acyl-coenzyme A thioesterase PaaI, contains HGG motif [Nocardia amikacinitolerans]|uniref:PaaI family thioesterase n=1 Tax=Nocardia amikacinitolerans TaxID=756689 RepID=UPI00082B614E|nr:PaaI family thioesterase [Nocardia amikacinitolerans]MCP2320722.1 Acyl-coenzyme A thioesterase PaaI, contains HGG motif [Nocardia amikacinitolerans]
MDSATMGDLVMAGFQKLGFIQYAGIEGVEFDAGRNVVAIAPRAEHLNHNGDLHAAVLFGLAETAAMGAAVSGIVDLMGETFIVARDGRIEYLARAKGSAGPFHATSEFDADTLERLRSDIAGRVAVELEVPVEIADGTGKPVAAATFTAVIRPRRK